MNIKNALTPLALVGAVVAGGLVVASSGTQAATTVQVYKSPTCGCCSAWVDHLQRAGYTVETHDEPDLRPIKAQAGVQPELASCHTAIVDGYVIEGHVPADVIAKLLDERPNIVGLAVPGMPTGSPGMEGPNAQPYDVMAFDRAGAVTVYQTVTP